MNPFSLLSKGETVKGLKNRGACYKMVAGNALPNFSSPKRPTAAASAAQPEPAQEVRRQKDEGRMAAAPTEEMIAQPSVQGTAHPTAVAAQAEEQPAEFHGSTESRPTGVAASTEEKPAEQARCQKEEGRAVAAATEEKPAEQVRSQKDEGRTVAASTEEKLSNSDQRRDAAAAVAAALMEKKPSKPGIWSGVLRGAGGWIGKRLFRGKAGPGSPSVQTELALEKVTVIRNDLSEDDLEVVEKAGRKTVRAVQNIEPGRLAPNP